jgi:2-phosphosulfolactate phosphatase
MTLARCVKIDFLPESARAYGADWAVVAVDILRATTTAVTIAWSGRRCIPVASLQEARELRGDLPEGFELQNSPTALACHEDCERPAVLLSSSGTRLIREAAAAGAVYAACLRNLTAQIAHLSANHPQVALIGAGTGGEFRREDQFGCARMAAALLDAGYEAADARTSDLIARWRDAPVDACAGGRSTEYLRRTGQLADLDFALTHLDDVDAVFEIADGELRRVSR